MLNNKILKHLLLTKAVGAALSLTEENRSHSNESAKQVDTALKKSSQLKGTIDTSIYEMQDSLNLTGQSIKEKEQEINDKIGAANFAVKKMQESAGQSISDISSELEKATIKVDDVYSRLEDFCTYMIVVFLLIYYVVYFFLFQFTYDIAVFGGATISAITALSFRIILDRANSKIYENKSAIIQHLNKANQALGNFWAKKLAIEPGLQRITNGFSQASRYGQTVISTVRDYIPTLSTFYASKERLNRQIDFINTLRNALTRYGFRLSPEANKCLTWFGPLTDSDTEWIKDVAIKLSALIETPWQIIVLAYADYKGDTQLAKNTWVNILKERTLVSSLAKMLVKNKTIETEHFEEGLDKYEAIEKIIAIDEPFNLDAFKKVYGKFYGSYSNEKKNLIDALRVYGFEIGADLEGRINKHVPKSFEEKERLESLFIIPLKDFTSEEFIVSIEMIELAYFEHAGEKQKRVQAWEELRKNNLDALSTVLIDHELVDIPTQYEDKSAEVTKFISSIIEPMPDFTILRAKIAVKQKFVLLDEIKRNFTRSLKFNKITDFEEKDMISLLPYDLKVEVIAEWLQIQVEIPTSILLLFYFDYIQDKRRKGQFISIRDSINKPQESNDLKRLSQLMINLEIIKGETKSSDTNRISAISNLFLLLKELEDYDRLEIQNTFTEYNKLLDYSKEIVGFLKLQGFVSYTIDIDFTEILKIVKLAQKDIFNRLQIITSEVISKKTQTINFPESQKSITLATLTLHLVSRRDLLQDDACISSSSDILASRILYQFSRVNDEEEQKGIRNKTRFVEIVQKTIDGTFEDYKYYEAFQKELHSGYLYQRISHLLEARLQAIDERIGDKEELEKKIKTYSGAVNTFLDSKLKANVILESLRMQLVSAYMITNPSSGDVITGVIDDCLNDACEELSYQGFLLLSDQSFGRGTRVGIVPFRMDFTKFSSKFEKAFKLAVEKHFDPEGKHKIQDYSGNLIRIFPSDAYFRRIDYAAPQISDDMDETNLPDDHPVKIVRKLVLKHFGPIHNLELLASLKSPEDKTLAMKSLLHTFFDANSTIYLMAEQQVNGLIAGSRFIEYIKSGKLDQDLVSEFGCATRSQLALTIYKAAGKDGQRTTVIKQKMAEELVKIIRQDGSRLNDDVINGLGSTIFQVLYDIGLVLNGLDMP
jgi:hypothetical protein